MTSWPSTLRNSSTPCWAEGPRRPVRRARIAESRPVAWPLSMFDALSDRLERIAGRLRSRGRLSDADLDEALREIRTALLEADVELGVVRRFTEAVRQQCAGEALSKSLTPGQQVIKAVHDELVAVLGGRDPPPHLRLAAADRRAPGRAAGLGQDHDRRQARPLVEAAGPQPAPRRRRPPAAGRRRAAAGARGPGRGDRLQRADRPGGRGPGRPRGGPAARAATCCIIDTAGRLAIDERAHGRGPADLGRRPARTTRSSSSTP